MLPNFLGPVGSAELSAGGAHVPGEWAELGLDLGQPPRARPLDPVAHAAADGVLGRDEGHGQALVRGAGPGVIRHHDDAAQREQLKGSVALQPGATRITRQSLKTISSLKCSSLKEK